MPLNIESLKDLDAAQQVRRSLLNQQLMSSMGNDAMLGVGVGASAAGIAGLARLLAAAMKKDKPVTVPAPTIKVRGKRPEENSKYASEQVKRAAVESILNTAVSGRGAKSVNALPYGLPLRALALLAGLGGGAMATNAVLGKAREQGVDSELEQARAEFEAALQGQTQGPNTKLAQAFDRIERATKQLGDKQLAKLDKKAADDLTSGLGGLMGLYALMAALGGGTAAYYGYKGGQKNQKARRYDLAIAAKQQRQRKQDPSRPVAVVDPEYQYME